MKSYHLVIANLYRNDRGSKVGGVLLAINNKLICEQFSVSNSMAIAVTINCSKKLIFGIVYIPPNSLNSYHSSVINFIHSLSLTNNTIIVGDFNYPGIDWLTLSGTNLNCDFIFDINFVQLETPTHIAGHTLDLYLLIIIVASRN